MQHSPLPSIDGNKDVKENQEYNQTLAGAITEGAILQDTVDGFDQKGSDHAYLQQKILKISEQIKIEQKVRDENVTEYLKLSENADKQQKLRIKSVFEKKNQKSKATILQLQKKLESYHKRLRDSENKAGNNISKQQRYGFKDVGANFVDSVKGGLSGISQGTKTAAEAFVTKPKDIASKLKNKFGSADNIAGLQDSNSDDYTRYGSADNLSSTTSNNSADIAVLDDVGSPKILSNSINHTQMLAILQTKVVELESKIVSSPSMDVKALQSSQSKLQRDLEDLNEMVKQDVAQLHDNLAEERFRCLRLEERNSRLEDQLNDYAEMHQHEVSDLRQEITSVAEKAEYYAQERARDMQEALEACRTRISKMELQQQQQHQQLITMEGFENATAKALLGKLVNLLLSVLAVILVFVSTITGLAMPLIRSQTRLLVSSIMVLIIIILYNKWDFVSNYVESWR